jgi:hypothetical protein
MPLAQKGNPAETGGMATAGIPAKYGVGVAVEVAEVHAQAERDVRMLTRRAGCAWN